MALPLAAINAAAAREKSIRHGHPSTLHLWWARRPLAAARAVLWASLVDDPSADESLSPPRQEAERERLFAILERLVRWESSNDAEVLAQARAEIDRCFPNGPPPVLDPFAGGGAIPLEAQRLGLTALAGDLNPVAVLINKAVIEIPPRFAGMAPVHPDIDKTLTTWERAQGLAADVRAYGRWMRDEAQRRIGHLYPDAVGLGGETLTPIAWIWARTVESPDPAWPGHVPLVASWTLCKRPGKPIVWVEPIIDRETAAITYKVRHGDKPDRERTIGRGGGVCIATGAAIPGDYIKAEGHAGRMGQQLMAVVAQGNGRVYRAPTEQDEFAAQCGLPERLPSGAITENSRYMVAPLYGMDEWWKLFTPRQLTALTTFSNLLEETASAVRSNAEGRLRSKTRGSSLSDDGVRLRDGGRGAQAYADAVVTYLAFAVDKCADYWSTICTWGNTRETMGHTFGLHAIPMTWDFAECNPFSDSTGNWMAMVNWVSKAVEHVPASVPTRVVQRDARVLMQESAGAEHRSDAGRAAQAVNWQQRALVQGSHNAVLSTDPPYYDNVPYSDISDFFYVWLRRNLAEVWPDECSTLFTPKAQELIADQQRAGSKERAKQHFESGMAEFMEAVTTSATPEAPATIYYAYKATENQDGEVRSTGWDTFLQAVIDAGLQVNATWPLRTERGNRLRSLGSNALASSVLLVCRPRPASALRATRGMFIRALRRELPEAVRVLQSGNIAPVDMAQSAIGPGIKIFSSYTEVLEADGTPTPVSEALSIINTVLGDVLDGEEANLDTDTRFALTWFAQHGYEPGPSGDADSVARAKNTSLAGIVQSGIGQATAGKFRLYTRDELDPGWHPANDERFTVWEATQHLTARLSDGESHAAALLHALGGRQDPARQLAYQLYKKADDHGWTSEAFDYNALIHVWPHLRNIAATIATATTQDSLL